ncbi:MAG: hypothetical protein WAM97_08260 [Acidimicrobiales bacterium]
MSTPKSRARRNSAPNRTAIRLSPTVLGVGAITLVLLIVLVIVAVGINQPAGLQEGAALQPAPLSLVREVTGVPRSVDETIGLPSELYEYPTMVTGHERLTKSGRPVLLYMGAEFCPYCAFERWAMKIRTLRRSASTTRVTTAAISSSNLSSSPRTSPRLHRIPAT